MILQVYTMYDKKTRSYAPYQTTKEDREQLKTTYERLAIKSPEEIAKYRDLILKYVGTFDDTTGLLTYGNMDDNVIDFDSLILDSLEVKNG